MNTTINKLEPGMPIIYNGNNVTYVSDEIAAKFKSGDRVIIVNSTGDILYIPDDEYKLAYNAVSKACSAFASMGSVTTNSITSFYHLFALNLADDIIWSKISHVNSEDVAQAKARKRSTTRLQISDKMRADMITGLREWRNAPSRRGQIIETVQHEGWRVQQVMAPLGVVGFVFEGRPNVFADATGVLRGGNCVVFRIGSDALGTARAIMQFALNPALEKAGLPEGSVTLLDSASHAAGWAMFSDNRLGLAVARGSGKAVAQLGSVARQSGVAVSLHGTGGAWMLADETADADKFQLAVYHSLDRKVCNTLNVCCIHYSRTDLIESFLAALRLAGDRRGFGYKLHVVEGDENYIPAELLNKSIKVKRACGDFTEKNAELLPESKLGIEWEWEETPEVTLKIVKNITDAIELCNKYSPQFVVSLISEDQEAAQNYFDTLNAPFCGNGFTRWVDGQYSLNRPELGLSNWEDGRLFARGGILSGDGVYTIRLRVIQDDPEIHR
jgi:glutamate-5-semialdehyde dehydrogenase